MTVNKEESPSKRNHIWKYSEPDKSSHKKARYIKKTNMMKREVKD
jgi:hypothetical protein